MSNIEQGSCTYARSLLDPNQSPKSNLEAMQ